MRNSELKQLLKQLFPNIFALQKYIGVCLVNENRIVPHRTKLNAKRSVPSFILADKTFNGFLIPHS